MNYFLPAAFVLASSASAVLACDEYVALDRVQVTDLMNTLRDTSADPLDQFFAFETLMCSDQAGVRDLTLRTGAASGNATIEGQVLLRALMEMEVIPVRLLEEEGLAKEQYERIKANPTEMLGVTFRDLPQACMSFHSDEECPPHSAISVTGTRATIKVRWNTYAVDGLFSLAEGGRLVGTFSIGNLTYPADISLF